MKSTLLTPCIAGIACYSRLVPYVGLWKVPEVVAAYAFYFPIGARTLHTADVSDYCHL